MENQKIYVEYYVIGCAMILLVILSFLQVLFRFVVNFSLSWTEELSRYIFILLVYNGVSLAIRENKHIRVEIIDMLLPKKMLKHLSTFNDIVILTLFGFISYGGVDIVRNAYDVKQVSPAIGIPMAIVYGIIPFMFLICSIRVIQGIIVRYRKEIV